MKKEIMMNYFSLSRKRENSRCIRMFTIPGGAPELPLSTLGVGDLDFSGALDFKERSVTISENVEHIDLVGDETRPTSSSQSEACTVTPRLLKGENSGMVTPGQDLENLQDLPLSEDFRTLGLQSGASLDPFGSTQSTSILQAKADISPEILEFVSSEAQRYIFGRFDEARQKFAFETLAKQRVFCDSMEQQATGPDGKLDEIKLYTLISELSEDQIEEYISRTQQLESLFPPTACIELECIRAFAEHQQIQESLNNLQAGSLIAEISTLVTQSSEQEEISTEAAPWETWSRKPKITMSELLEAMKQVNIVGETTLEPVEVEGIPALFEGIPPLFGGKFYQSVVISASKGTETVKFGTPVAYLAKQSPKTEDIQLWVLSTTISAATDAPKSYPLRRGTASYQHSSRRSTITNPEKDRVGSGSLEISGSENLRPSSSGSLEISGSEILRPSDGAQENPIADDEKAPLATPVENPATTLLTAMTTWWDTNATLPTKLSSKGFVEIFPELSKIPNDQQLKSLQPLLVETINDETLATFTKFNEQNWYVPRPENIIRWTFFIDAGCKDLYKYAVENQKNKLIFDAGGDGAQSGLEALYTAQKEISLIKHFTVTLYFWIGCAVERGLFPTLSLSNCAYAHYKQLEILLKYCDLFDSVGVNQLIFGSQAEEELAQKVKNAIACWNDLNQKIVILPLNDLNPIITSEERAEIVRELVAVPQLRERNTMLEAQLAALQESKTREIQALENAHIQSQDEIVGLLESFSRNANPAVVEKFIDKFRTDYQTSFQKTQRENAELKGQIHQLQNRNQELENLLKTNSLQSRNGSRFLFEYLTTHPIVVTAGANYLLNISGVVKDIVRGIHVSLRRTY